MEVKKKTIRCAIYTRKSSEEGLEQDFNPLMPKEKPANHILNPSNMKAGF